MKNRKVESTEHRVLAALRELDPQKHAEIVAVVEAMATAFPKPVKVSLAPPISLRLVVKDGCTLGTGERPGHHQERILPALGQSAVLTK